MANRQNIQLANSGMAYLDHAVFFNFFLHCVYFYVSYGK